MGLADLLHSRQTPEPEPQEVEQTEEVLEVDEAPEEDVTEEAEEAFMEVDEDTLSEDDRAAYKSMQAAFTKKTQELAEIRKSMEQKAQMFDQLMSDPEKARELLGGGQQKNQTSVSGLIPLPHEGVDYRTFFEGDVGPGIENAVVETVNRFLMPQLNQAAQLLISLVEERESAKIAGVAKQYPGAEARMDEIREFIRNNPRLDPEQAVLAVVGRDLLKDKAKPKKAATPKPHTLLPRSSVSASGKKSPTSRFSLEDAVAEIFHG